MKRWILAGLLVLGGNTGCTRTCGELDVWGTGITIVDLDDDDPDYSFDQTYNLRCGTPRSDTGLPPHFVSYFPDGTITDPTPAWGFFFTSELRNRGADFALGTAVRPLLFTDGRLQTRLTPGDGLVGNLDIEKNLDISRQMQHDEGGNWMFLDAWMPLEEGWLEVTDWEEKGATCDDAGEWLEVRLRVAYDLQFGPISELPTGARPADSGARMTGESWFSLEKGIVGNELYERLNTWCALEK
ncbi:MAG: hypothetical protein AB8H79_23000 [Myxococcota bacterium]